VRANYARRMPQYSNNKPKKHMKDRTTKVVIDNKHSRKVFERNK
jgi:hypothetical protein